MQESDVKAIVAAVLAEQRAAQPPDLDRIVLKALATILTSFGIEEADRKELQADFRHLRRWRKSVEQAESLTFKAIVAAIASGVIGAIWLGIKASLGK